MKKGTWYSRNLVFFWTIIIAISVIVFGAVYSTQPVSYTHLDVYKRQSWFVQCMEKDWETY